MAGTSPAMTTSFDARLTKTNARRGAGHCFFARSFPRKRESSWAAPRWVPAFAGTSGKSLLLRRLRRSGRGRRRDRVHLLDLGFGAQLGHEIGLRLARDILLDLLLHLVEARRRLLALVLDLDHVPAELRVHRLGYLALVELEGHVGEFWHHLFLGEVAEVAAVCFHRRVLGGLARDLGEVLAL